MADEAPYWARIPIVEETLRLYASANEGFRAAFPRIEELGKAAFTDPMTSLLNRAALEARSLTHDKSLEAGHAVVYVDVADFKKINEIYETKRGDSALRNIAKVLQSIEKATGSISFRKGGDEFVVLVPPDDLEFFLCACEKKLASLPCDAEGTKFSVTCNVGFCRPDGLVGLPELMDRAETACKVQKHRGVTTPLEWSASIVAETPVDSRRKCQSCRATATILVVLEKKTPDCLKKCPNCGADYPAET